MFRGRLNSYGRGALALAEYGQDFAATRQRTVDDGSLFSFKRVPEVTHGADLEGVKKINVNYAPLVFGTVEGIFTIAGKALARLICPADASCDLSRLFGQQQAQLIKILEEDAQQMGGYAKTSWADANPEFPATKPASVGFYVQGEPSSLLIGRLDVGEDVVMHVGIRRIDHDAGQVADSAVRDVIRALIKTDFFQSNRINGTARPNFLNLVKGWSEYIIDGGSRSLAFAQYKTDFVPWEEANVGPTHNSVSGDTFDHPRVMIKANSREMFVARAFGEIAEIVPVVSNEHGFYVRLCCPSNASCAAEDVYFMQAEKLQNIINEDELTSGDIPGASWFTAKIENDSFERGGRGGRPGDVAGGTMHPILGFNPPHRRQLDQVEATPEDIPTKGEGYVCDSLFNICGRCKRGSSGV
ncbi:hypothetical protein C8R43DRAFT_955697 [Mycena crocata]|nr:hypothetical protein C8R43DRAFT_955697 [Mycena crocata]